MILAGLGLSFLGEVTDVALQSTSVTVNAAFLQGLPPETGFVGVDFPIALPAGARLFACVATVATQFTGSEGAITSFNLAVKTDDDAMTYAPTEPPVTNAVGETQTATTDFRTWGGETLRLTFLASGLVDLTNCTGGSLNVTVFYAPFPA